MKQTKIIDSSLKSILNVTIPIFLSTLSTNLMYVIDRFMLARYSIDAMNASVISGNFVSIFTFFMTSIASTAEIFVGQYNGSEQYEKISIPIWQMIYLSFASVIFFVPVAYFSEYINTFPQYYFHDGVIYQKVLMYFAFLPPLRVSLAAFFIGQGKTKIVTICVIIGTLSNFILDYILIYGVDEIVPSMGSYGAAIATAFSEFLQTAILAMIFFKRNNRKKYHTIKNYNFDKKIFLECMRVGLPIAVGVSITMIVWYLIQIIISHLSKDHATVYNIGINIYVIFIFIGDGMIKASSTICSNMIGEGDILSIEKTYRTFILFAIITGVLISIPLVFSPHWLLAMLDMLPDNLSFLYNDVKIVLKLVALNVILETILCAIWGILTAGGDTKYPMKIYQIYLWLLVMIPIAALRYFNLLNSIPIVYLFMTVWMLVTTFFIHRRYRSMKWYNKLV